MPKQPENEVLLVDLSGIYWSAWHSSANDDVSAAHQRAVAQVRKMIDGFKHVAICCDSGPSFRKDISPDYKANRPEKDKAAIGELERVNETLRKDGLLLWSAKGFEADDIIATATRRALIDDLNVVIASADKDMMQLVSSRVTCWSTMSYKRYGPVEVLEKFGVSPPQVRDWLALVGDSSDNIKGVAGIGPKRAAELLTTWEDIDGIQTALWAGDGKDVGTPAIVKALKESDDIIDLARDLVTLRDDVPIDFAQLYQERTQESLVTEEIGNMDEPDPELDSPAEVTSVEADPGPIGDPAGPAEVSAAPETALVVATPIMFERGLEPSSLGTAKKMAMTLWDSRLYTRFKNPESIWAVIVRGREMGLGAMTSLDSFHVIEGKPAPHAHLIIARVKAHPDCEYFQFIEGDDKHAIWETKNRNNPKPTRLEYTIEQARTAGIVKSGGNWEKRPDEMLRKTCAVQLGRVEYPGATMGLYAVEELGGEE